MRYKILPILFTSIVFSFLLFIFSAPKLAIAQDISTTPPFSDRHILVRFRPSLSDEERLKFHKLYQVEKSSSINNIRVDVLKLKDNNIQDSIKLFSVDPRVEYAEPDYIATTFETTNDPGIIKNLQWGMYKIKAAGKGISAWNNTKSDLGIKIAILDTGIDQNNEDLNGKIVANKNCTDSSTVDDLFGHGTHVAGIAAAQTNNGVGVAGVGYMASLMNVKVLSDQGYGYYSWIADCIVWAADNGAKVINMSLGGPSPSKTLENAINYAWNKGVVIVAAAGNSGNSSPNYPGYYKNVISVAATDQNDNKANFSSYGFWVTVAAPGVSIYSTMPNHPNAIGLTNYGYLSGTSMATPHVSGLAALVWSTSFGIDNNQVRRDIEGSSDRIRGTGKYWIYGRVNALSAVTGFAGSLKR